MFHWFKVLSSGNKIAFILSVSIVAASIGYSTATSFIAGSNGIAQPIFPNIISSPLPQLTPTSSPTPAPTVIATTIPTATTPTTQPSPKSTVVQPPNPSHSNSEKSDQSGNKPQNNQSQPKNDNNNNLAVKSIPAGAAALCRDGSYSFSLTRQGACSHHGGVDQWLQS